MSAEVRPKLRRSDHRAQTTAFGSLATRRGLPQDRRQDRVSVARRRRRGRGARHAGSIEAGPEGSAEIAAETGEAARLCSGCDRDGSASIVRRGTARPWPGRSSRHRRTLEQPGGGLASADPTPREATTPFQVAGIGAALPLVPRPHRQSLQRPAPSDFPPLAQDPPCHGPDRPALRRGGLSPSFQDAAGRRELP